MAECRVRLATGADLPVLARMRQSLARHMAACDPDLWELAPEHLLRVAEFYGEILKKENARIFLALDSTDTPIGMIMVRILENPAIRPSRFGRIDDAWVEPGCRRQGVMRALVRATIQFTEARGARHATLDYSVQNAVSAAAWHRLGFRPALVVAQATLEQIRLRCRGASPQQTGVSTTSTLEKGETC
jgi:ribosomal protein S18 acetylase RimI-like enzyme